MRLGDTLRAYRVHNEMTIGDMARSIGLRINTYRDIELGVNPRSRVRHTLIQWLMGDETGVSGTTSIENTVVSLDNHNMA